MIKNLLISILFCSIFTFSFNGSTPNHNISSDIVKSPPDTIFILRELNKHWYHAVYIDTTRPSKYYERITDFKFDEYEKEGYMWDCKHIVERDSNTFKPINNSDLPENWIRIYPYNNKFYVYAPSEWGSLQRKIINDSAYVIWLMDGPLPFPLKTVKEREKNTWYFEFLNGSEEVSLTIYEIDGRTKLSVFEMIRNGDYSYELHIPAENAYFYDIIVNYCKGSKIAEFEFDKIDYKELIKKSRHNRVDRPANK